MEVISSSSVILLFMDLCPGIQYMPPTDAIVFMSVFYCQSLRFMKAKIISYTYLLNLHN